MKMQANVQDLGVVLVGFTDSSSRTWSTGKTVLPLCLLSQEEALDKAQEAILSGTGEMIDETFNELEAKLEKDRHAAQALAFFVAVLFARYRGHPGGGGGGLPSKASIDLESLATGARSGCHTREAKRHQHARSKHPSGAQGALELALGNFDCSGSTARASALKGIIARMLRA